jgi:esterase/lipase superfamily enzyme
VQVEELIRNTQRELELTAERLALVSYSRGYDAAVETIEALAATKRSKGDQIAAEVLVWAAKELRGDL